MSRHETHKSQDNFSKAAIPKIDFLSSNLIQNLFFGKISRQFLANKSMTTARYNHYVPAQI